MTIDPQQLGQLERIDARKVWQHEALEFTPWLSEHVDELNKAIGLEIEVSGREVKVGPFAVDLYGTEVQTGHPAIIENQFSVTDHSHLGQILTYASGLKAGVTVWISPQFRDEHREALTWLNEISSEDVNFFGVEIEILEINGQYAPNFKLVVQPNTWQKSRAVAKQSGGGQVSEKMLMYQSYFGELLEEMKSRSPDITNASKTQPQSWFNFASGKGEVSFMWAFVTGRRFCVQLSIDTSDGDRNREMFDALATDRSAIESEFGGPLEWEPSDSRKSQRISIYYEGSVDIAETPREDLDELKEWAVSTMIRCVEVLRPRVKALP